MLSFKSFPVFIIEETQDPKHEIHYYDLDDTLVHHDNNKLRVHVVDHHGNRVNTLSSSEFNTHSLPHNHKYDFSEFRSSDVFGQSAHPIKKVIRKLQSMADRGRKVEILTARSDLDDQPKFAHHMEKFGIDIDKIHVRRAGNEEAKKPAEAKKAVIARAIDKHRYKRVHLYDDSKDNLEAMLSLKKKYKDVEFHAHHVRHNPKTGETKITTRKV
jgi:hypothetical protein